MGGLRVLKLLKLNLQHFADGEESADQTASNNSEGQEQTGTTTEKVEENLYKQEDVNNVVAKESKKATEKLLKELGIDDFDNAKEGMEKFREWQESQKTEQEKQQESYNKLTEEKTTLENEKAELVAQISAMKKGVKGDSVEDVVALAKQRVSDELTIDEAIDQIVEKYPHFASQEEEKEEDKPSFTTGRHYKEQVSSDAFKAKLAKYK